MTDQDNSELHIDYNPNDKYFTIRVPDALVCELLKVWPTGERTEQHVRPDEIEKLATAVHKAYCENHKIRTGKDYWTRGDYNRLDDTTKEIDRATVRAVLSLYEAETAAELERVKVISADLLKACKALKRAVIWTGSRVEEEPKTMKQAEIAIANAELEINKIST